MFEFIKIVVIVFVRFMVVGYVYVCDLFVF